MASLTKQERSDLKGMFGGKCAYCGIELGDKWHADHVEPVNRKGKWSKGKWVLTGDLHSPQNDRKDNFHPACVKCNILKSDANVEGFRRNLSYFARSIEMIRTYSHVHHLMRFGKLSIDYTPVKFWFETYLAERGMEG